MVFVGPVRGINFHSNQPLFVSGGDDYKIKVGPLLYMCIKTVGIDISLLFIQCTCIANNGNPFNLDFYTDLELQAEEMSIHSVGSPRLHQNYFLSPSK